MAFYAEMKRRRWYCVIGINMITWYRHKLYDDWYNSLTEEQKQKLEEAKRKRQEQHEKELDAAIKRMAIMTASIIGMSSRSNYNKYHGVYDEFGFPRI